MPLVHRLNHNNIITVKSPLGLPQKNNQTKPFIGVWDLVTELQARTVLKCVKATRLSAQSVTNTRHLSSSFNATS